MTDKLQVYKCSVCGIIVEALHAGKGQMVCCDEPMELLEEQTAEMAKEKHVPVVEKIDGGYKVTVGSTLHPMEEKHHIEWIELIADGKTCMQFLKPGSEPVAIFKTDAQQVTAREHCNIHGLWKN